MTNQVKNSVWNTEELSTARSIILTNKDKNMEERFQIAGRVLGRTSSAVQFKWYNHIKNIRSIDEVVTPTPVQTSSPSLVKVKTVKAYEALTGEIFLDEKVAVEANVNYILNKLESTDNLYKFIKENKEMITYLMNN
jgi:hypothetical protein